MVPSADRRAHDALHDHGRAGTCTHIYMPLLRSAGSGAADKETEPAKG